MRDFWKLLFSAQIALISFGCGSRESSTPMSERPVPNELPRSWDMEEIVNASGPRVPGRVYVLAWSITEDDRPLRCESCLTVKVLKDDDGFGRWHFTHLYRHPHEEKPEWQQSLTHCSFGPGHKYFPGVDFMHYKRMKDKPTNELVYASFGVEELNWSFAQRDGFKFVGCGVCEKSWLEVIGEKPTQFFGH